MNLRNSFKPKKKKEALEFITNITEKEMVQLKQEHVLMGENREEL